MSALFSLVRHSLTAFGAQFVAQGYLSSDQLTAAVGAIMTLAGLAWSVYNGQRKR